MNLSSALGNLPHTLGWVQLLEWTSLDGDLWLIIAIYTHSLVDDCVRMLCDDKSCVVRKRSIQLASDFIRSIRLRPNFDEGAPRVGYRWFRSIVCRLCSFFRTLCFFLRLILGCDSSPFDSPPSLGRFIRLFTAGAGVILVLDLFPHLEQVVTRILRCWPPDDSRGPFAIVDSTTCTSCVVEFSGFAI